MHAAKPPPRVASVVGLRSVIIDTGLCIPCHFTERVLRAFDPTESAYELL